MTVLDPIDESINILKRKLFQNPEALVKRLSKNNFSDLLKLTNKESFFTFNKRFRIQVDGPATGSHLGSILTNMFLSHHEQSG